MFLEFCLVIALSFTVIFFVTMVFWLFALCFAEYKSPEDRKEHFQLWFMSLLALPAIWVWPVTLVAGVVWGVYKAYGYAFPNEFGAEKDNLVKTDKGVSPLITSEDISYHIANSVEGYEDEYGYYFNVRDHYGVLFVDVYYNDEPVQEFMLECKEVN